MGYLKVDEAGAQAIVAALQHNAAARQQDIGALSAKVAPGDVWVGQAATAYENAYLAWQKAEAGLITALNDLAQQTQRIVNNFMEIDRVGGSAF